MFQPARSLPRSIASRLSFAAGAALLGLGVGSPVLAQLGPPSAPAENPITPEKAVLGKILFWDEQLSSDDTVACGTCHRPGVGGSDPRSAPAPGPDGVPGSPDDVFGSPGVIRQDADGNYEPDLVFDLARQVTGRHSPTFIGAQYFTELFWDGRASEEFVDPQSGLVSIVSGGALESQAIGPPVSDVEMAHTERDWTEIIAKLEGVEPLRLATDLPLDVAEALALRPSYPELFDGAFADSEITAERIAMALATYQRTLVPDQTPWDRFVRGEPGVLTPDQVQGLDLFTGAARCVLCHRTPLFADDDYHALGVRPPAEDLGRQLVTGDPADRGRFKTPTLRNVGLRRRFMHQGGFNNLGAVITFYVNGGGAPDNKDPLLLPVLLTPMERNQLIDFIVNGLTDPRVPAELPPFDRPRLHVEQVPRNPRLFGPGHAGSGGEVPLIIADVPPAAGSGTFKVGVGNALGGARAILAVARSAGPPGQSVGGVPVNIALDPDPRRLAIDLESVGEGKGFGTLHRSIPDDPGLIGRSFFVQWFIRDPGAAGGFSATRAAELVIF